MDIWMMSELPAYKIIRAHKVRGLETQTGFPIIIFVPVGRLCVIDVRWNRNAGREHASIKFFR